MIHQDMLKYNTKVTPEDLANGVADEFNVLYSKDGKRLLKNQDDQLKKYRVKDNTEIICDGAFTFDHACGCNPCPDICLEEVILPKSLKAIGDRAFYSCFLPVMDFPEGLVSIGNNAFHFACFTIVLPESLEYIGDNAFSQFIELEDVFIPRNVAYIGKAPFVKCFNLTNITVDPANEHFTTYNGILCDKSLSRIIQVPVGLGKSIVLPNQSLYVDPSAFIKLEVSIPLELKKRWLINNIKQMMLSFVNKPLGSCTFYDFAGSEIASLKIGNNLYCNIQSGMVGKHCSVGSFIKVLGFGKGDFAKRLGIAEEVTFTNDNYKEYIGRTCASNVDFEWEADFVDEDTGDVITSTVRETIVPQGTCLSEEWMEIINEYSTKICSTLLYDQDFNQYWFDISFGNEQENTITSQLERLVSLCDKKMLAFNIFDASRMITERYGDIKPLSETRAIIEAQEEIVDWPGLIIAFFDRKMRFKHTKTLSLTNLWKQFESFCLRKGVSVQTTEDFIKSFSFLKLDFTDDCFSGWEYLFSRE